MYNKRIVNDYLQIGFDDKLEVMLKGGSWVRFTRWHHQMSVETEETEDSTLEIDPVLDCLYCGSQARRLSSAFISTSHQVSLSSRESADSKCLMMVNEPCLTKTKLSLSVVLPARRLSSRNVFIRAQISLGAMETF